ncbi:acyl-CoA thioesterase [Streptomyces iranensis]|uniref:acyl-CoA thioesterase n=1 Tax=Streptomyces iranensis TaxID=576784 RepID=UPI0039B792AC
MTEAETPPAGSHRDLPGRNGSLAELLGLEQVERHSFRGLSRRGGMHRKFGGEIAGQAAMAAGLTVARERTLHSAHTHFLREGNSDAPVTYRVRPVRDGTSISTRQVDGLQDGHLICQLTASFQREGAGFDHQIPRGSAPPPEQLPTVEELLRDDPENLAWAQAVMARGSVEFRFPIPPNRVVASRGASTPPRQRIWIRARAPLPGGPLMHRAALLYLSDYLLLSVAATHHGVIPQDPGIQFATIDHSVWFHHFRRADEWLLHEQESPWAGQGLALCRGFLFDRDGALVASTQQQGLLRRRDSGVRVPG